MAWYDTAWDFLNSEAGGAIAGAAAGALMGSQSGPSTTTTTSNQTMPDYLKPYTTGAGGIYPLSQATYLKNMSEGYPGQTPEQQAAVRAEIVRQGRLQAPGATMGVGRELLAGQYDPNLAGLGLDMGAQYAGMGPLDPTGALQQALSGNVNTDVLGSMQQANIDRSMQGYQDMTDAASRAFTEQINPAIRQGAQMAGQYGGSRQGLAQGMAARDIGEQLARSAENLTESAMGYGNELYGNAYQQAAAQQAGTGMFLGQQAQDVGEYQTEFDTMRAMLEPQTALQNKLLGAQTLGSGEQAAGAQFQDIYGLQGLSAADKQAAQQFQWDQLANYGGLVQGQPNVAQTTISPGMNPLAAAGYGMNIGQAFGALGNKSPYSQQQNTNMMNAFAS